MALGSQRALGLMGVLPSGGVYYLPGSSAEPYAGLAALPERQRWILQCIHSAFKSFRYRIIVDVAW